MRRLGSILSALALGGCSFAPHNVRPELPVPPSWPVGDAYLAQSEALLPSVAWRDVFRDPRLQSIIAQALATNRDLRVAVANINAARALYREQRAARLPEVDISSRYGYAGTGASTTGTASGTTGATGSAGTTGVGGTGGNRLGSSFSVNGGVSAFELDIFGRVRSLTRAAQDRYFSQAAAARAVRLSLIGNVATDWLTYAADASLLQVARETVKIAQNRVDLTQARLNGGIAPRTDVALALSILTTAQADVANQTTLVAQDANALQLLVGAPVDPALLSSDVQDAAATIALLPAGLDSRILLRRPDVVQAEYTLYAANAQIGAARAQLFPTISLTGLAGLASTALSALFTGGAFSYSGAAGITYPIFRAGAARANVTYNLAQRDASLATYEHSIQTAFEETANALARAGTLDAQLAANRAGVAAAQDALNLTNARYRGGIDPFLTSLDAQRTLYAAQRTLATTYLTAGTARATLYRVLGGDATLDATAQGPVPVTPAGSARTDDPLPPANPRR